MAITIANISPKGGVGKTTLSILLAGEFREARQTVAIVDCDPRQNVTEWRAALKATGRPISGIEVITATGQTARTMLEHSVATFDAVIIDCQGSEDDITDIVIQFTDLVVVPFQLGQQDISAVLTVRNYINAASTQLRRTVPMLAVLNRVNIHTRTHPAYSALEGLFARFQVPFSKNELWERRPFNRITGDEIALYDMVPNKSVEEAKNNIRHLFIEIIENLQIARSAA